jgi:hypothetical protein
MSRLKAAGAAVYASHFIRSQRTQPWHSVLTRAKHRGTARREFVRIPHDREQDFHGIVNTLAECVEKRSRSVAR